MLKLNGAALAPNELYTRLGLEPSATDKEIKAAYRQAAKACHPDQHPDDPEARARFDAISEARDILLNPETRRLYDSTGTVDRSPIESINTDALTNIVGAFMSIVDSHPNPERVDLIALVRRVVPNARTQVQNTEAVQTKMRQRYEAVQGRLQQNKGSNLLGKALEDALKKCEATLTACTREHRVLDRMTELLEGYSFDYINEMAASNSITNHLGWSPMRGFAL